MGDGKGDDTDSYLCLRLIFSAEIFSVSDAPCVQIRWRTFYLLVINDATTIKMDYSHLWLQETDWHLALRLLLWTWATPTTRSCFLWAAPTDDSANWTLKAAPFLQNRELLKWGMWAWWFLVGLIKPALEGCWSPRCLLHNLLHSSLLYSCQNCKSVSLLFSPSLAPSPCTGTSPNKLCAPLIPFWILLLEETKLTYHFEYITLDNWYQLDDKLCLNMILCNSKKIKCCI